LETVSKLSIILKFKGYLSLLKLRLSSLVVMSAFFGYLLADGDVLSFEFIELIIGGLFITGSADGFN
jgi:Polyprenyltransferase (cytochrome oxidase assembly factor)